MKDCVNTEFPILIFNLNVCFLKNMKRLWPEII